MWIILIIILTINSMWLLKLNKDLAIRQLSDNAKGLKEKGYEILVMDNTFDFSEINTPEEEIKNLKKVLEDNN